MMLMVDIQQNCILWNNDGENVLFSSSLDYILYENLRRKSTTLCILTSPLRRLLNAPLKIPTSLIKFHILHKDHKRNSNIVRCFFRYLQRLFFSFFEYEVEIWRWWWWQCWTATALSSVAIFFFFFVSMRYKFGDGDGGGAEPQWRNGLQFCGCSSNKSVTLDFPRESCS